SKKKGLSAEEKRTKMMEFFYEKANYFKDFFQLKELEKLCQKEKGITSMSVKEVLQSLVDDGMVDTDKIGTSVYFWAFPSKASQNRKRKLDELSVKLEEMKKKKMTLEESIKGAASGREQSNERDKALHEVNELKSTKEELLKELEKYKECDPEVMQQMKVETTVAREAINRWTDNIFSFKSWMKKKFMCEEATINKQFEIPESLDYVE
ncbi:hypothetical protein HELRODRAFT_85168, partial [Helobdella robusta]|uniref:Meiotic nuclear division protein 1 homolog n=1 Tax=Helobdella robusta TaxID=6412 RepID=T1G5T7_HELRO